MKIEPVTDRISLVRGKRDGSFPYSNSILIRDEEVVLIDTGCGIDNLEQLRKEFNIDYVINSHTHPDHSAGNWVFHDRPIHMPEEGFDTAGDVVAISHRFVNDNLAPTFQEFVRETFGFKNCRPTGSYNRQTFFVFGETTLVPIHTPGHTKDHYCFYEPDKRILFSFDYDLTQFPWYGHRESDLLEFRESIRRLRDISPDIVVSSHRGVVTLDIDREFDMFCQILDERDERILLLLDSGKTVDQLVEFAPVYGSFPYVEPVLRYWEGKMIEKHLEQLETAGRVEKRGVMYLRS